MIESVKSAQEELALVLIFSCRSPDYIWSGEERQIVFDCADPVSWCATYHYYQRPWDGVVGPLFIDEMARITVKIL